MPYMSILITKAVLVVILFVGNYLGGKLILQHHIGEKKHGALNGKYNFIFCATRRRNNKKDSWG
jgi:hypothetical protein